MESICKILESFSSVIYAVTSCRFSDQGCIFIESDIINYQLRIRVRSNKKKLIIIWGS